MNPAAHDGFGYRMLDGQRQLFTEGVALAQIAAAVGTPFYCYSSAVIHERYDAFAHAFTPLKTLVCYAVKANDNPAVVRLLARLGAGADVVSGGELARALHAGVAPEKIVFSGVGKSAAEMESALAAGIHQFNVESEAELELLARLAEGAKRTAAVALRVNPNIAAGSHDKVSTGRRHDKFGIALDRIPALYRRAQSLKGLRPVGLAVHIGSQILTLDPFAAAIQTLTALVRALRADGLAVERLDLGGGLGIDYGAGTPPSIEDYAAVVARETRGLGLALAIEPGRALVGPAGLLVARVLYIKRQADRRFAILDAAMNDLMRPSLYGARHPVRLIAPEGRDGSESPCDLVGPVCESGDIFARDLMLPELASGDLLAFDAAGAYGAVMASQYNARPLVPEVLVKGTRSAVIRARPSREEMDALYRLPDWLSGQDRSR